MDHRDDRSQVKGFVAKNNTTFKLKHVKISVESSVIKVHVGMETFVSKAEGYVT